MREMPTVRQVHAHDRVAVLEQPDIDRRVCLRAAVRLHIDMLRAEQLLRARNRGLLHEVDAGAAAVIPVVGIPLRVLVGEDRAGCQQHRVRHHILGCNQFKTAALPVIFRANRRPHLGVKGAQFFNVFQYHCKASTLLNAILSSLLYTFAPRFTRDSLIFSPFASFFSRFPNRLPPYRHARLYNLYGNGCTAGRKIDFYSK